MNKSHQIATNHKMQFIKIHSFAYCLICVLILPHSLLCQDTEYAPFGAMDDSAAWMDMPLMPHFAQGQKGEVDMPFAMSMRAYCPTPLDQGKTSACAGFALGYGAMTAMLAKEMGLTKPHEINKIACSPWFIYNQIKIKAGSCNTPASMESAIRVLKEKGICLHKEFSPGIDDCDALPDQQAMQSAEKRKIRDAAVLFEWRAPAERKIVAIKNALSGGAPVVVTMKVFKSFRSLPSGTKYWRMRNAEMETYLDKHFILLSGYDDRNETFELMSSWGTNWADGGFAYVSYQDFAQVCLMAYQILPHATEPQAIAYTPPTNQLEKPKSTSPAHPHDKTKTPQKQTDLTAAAGQANPQATKPVVHTSITKADAPVFLQGKFAFCQPVWNEQKNTWDYVPEPIQFDQSTGLYQTQKNTYPVNTPFVLRSSAIPTGKYVYVFSCDPTGKVDLHWPKDARAAQFMPSDHAVISIPTKGGALALKHPGDDYLCILYAEDKIADIHDRLALLRPTAPEQFMRQLYTVFPFLLREQSKVKYTTTEMQAQSIATRKDGIAMVLVLKVKGE